jgi:uncharacterized protein (TIRG00374 family)
LLPPASMKAGWVSWLVGLAILAAVVAVSLRFSEAAQFARLLEQLQPAWLAAALALQAGTYIAQGEVWRSVMRSAGLPLPRNVAYGLSLVKLLIDQALPSSGVSGAIVVANALERRGIPQEVAMAGIVVSSAAYLLAYVIALGTGLVLLVAEDRANAPIMALALVFIVGASALASAEIALSGRPSQWHGGRAGRWIGRLLELLASARAELSHDRRLLAVAVALQLVIVALDCLTLWTLLRALGGTLALAAVFASFMISTLLRTISIVPGGLGTFEAVLVIMLSDAGMPVPLALSATLLFRGLTFWLPMLPAAVLARSVRRRI